MKVNPELKETFVGEIEKSLNEGVHPEDILMTLGRILNDYMFELDDIRADFIAQSVETSQ